MEETQIRSLVQLAQSGDREAFGQLVTAFEPIVYRVVLRRLRDASDAREVTQEVFLRAMRKIGQLREPERFAGWLRQIAVRMSISNIVRRPGVATVSVQTFDAFQSDPTTPVDTLLKTEEAEQVWAGLKQLKQLDRETLIAFYINGNSLAEMSGSFRRPIGTIKRRLHTARHRLRATLGNLGSLHPVNSYSEGRTGHIPGDGRPRLNSSGNHIAAELCGLFLFLVHRTGLSQNRFRWRSPIAMRTGRRCHHGVSVSCRFPGLLCVRSTKTRHCTLTLFPSTQTVRSIISDGRLFRPAPQCRIGTDCR